jgi:hypothetical protein
VVIYHRLPQTLHRSKQGGNCGGVEGKKEGRKEGKKEGR